MVSRHVFASLSILLTFLVMTSGCEQKLSDDYSVSSIKLVSESSIDVASVGRFSIPCNDLGSGFGDCFWRYKFDRLQCSPNCDKLVIFFGGGGMTCDRVDYPTDNILDHYSEAGYIAVCADLFKSALFAETYPFVDEAGRVDVLIKNITSFFIANELWTGKHLLFSGVSHGATAPVIAMARTPLDNQDYWHGSVATGACFYDGIYDVDAQVDFIIENRCDSVFDMLSYNHYFRRYCFPSPPPGFPEICSSFYEASILDNLITPSVMPRVFYLKDWKLISCGSGATKPCSYDLVPRVSTEGLCNIIDFGAGSCEFEDLPYSQGYDHFNCAIERIDLCQDWFDNLAAAYQKL